jgi:hypothetical protein
MKMCILSVNCVCVIKNRLLVKVDMTLQMNVHVYVISIGSFITCHLDMNISNGTLIFKMF